MSFLSFYNRLNNSIIGCYKTVIIGRNSLLNPVQTCNYAKKSPEDVLGIEKPKRPLTPYFRFLTQIRPQLLAKQPDINNKEVASWVSKHWHELDEKAKSQIVKEYQKDMEDYKKIRAMYLASLTEEQKVDIKRVKEEMAIAKEKRKLKAEYKKMERPKRPMTSYFLFVQSRKEKCDNNNVKEFQEKMKKEWSELSAEEKSKYEIQGKNLMKKYKQDLQAWELKMIKIGRDELVRASSNHSKKSDSINTQ